jgi:methyl-accepting chemotaxis protein
VKDAMNGIGTDIGQINEAVRTISESGETNARNIRRIKQEVERFRTE